MKRIRVAATLALAILFLPGGASASNWRFLQDSPISQFSEEDFERFRAAGRRALDEAADGQTVEWKNPKTGAYGTIQPLDTREVDGTTCRRAEVFNSAGGTKGTSRFTFCRQEDGTWKAGMPDS